MSRPSLESLTLKQKISQLLMVRQSVTMMKLVGEDWVYRSDDEIKEIMGKYQYGSIWSSGQQLMNTVNMAESGTKIKSADNRRIIEVMNEALEIPALVGIDCETGTGRTFSDGCVTCPPLAIGAADDEELTFKLSAAISREVKASGANWRWMPVVDLTNRFNGISAGRAFSDDIDKLVKHARAVVRGAESEKVVSTVKHFPGSDPYEIRDSHIVPTSINLSLEEWRETQALTFKGVIEAGVDSVMVGHSAFPAADDTVINGFPIPSTLSSKIMQGLLREEMGFDGVIITDAVNMAGLKSIAPYEEVLAMAINAGADILLGVNPTDYEYIEKAVLDGKISMERINESAERVLKLKEKIGLFDDKKPEPVDMTVQKPITEAIDREIAEKSVTLLYDKNNMLPLNPEKVKNVTIVCSSHTDETWERLEVMKEEFEKRGANVEIIGDIANPDTIEELAETKDLIIYAAYISGHTPIGMPSLYGDKMKTYFHAFTYGKEKSIGVSLGYPYAHIDFMCGANTFFNLYGPGSEMMRAFVKAVYGEIEPNRNSPIDITPKRRVVFG